MQHHIDVLVFVLVVLLDHEFKLQLYVVVCLTTLTNGEEG